MSFAKNISPVMQELENAFLDVAEVKQDYDLDTFRAGIYIFQSVIMDKLFDKQLRENISIENAMKEAEMTGYKIRALVLETTGIDTMELYQ